MLDYQIITDDRGKVLACLAYCTLDLAMRTAAEYKRVLGVCTFRNTVRCAVAPTVGTVLPEFCRAVQA